MKRKSFPKNKNNRICMGMGERFKLVEKIVEKDPNCGPVEGAKRIKAEYGVNITKGSFSYYKTMIKLAWFYMEERNGVFLQTENKEKEERDEEKKESFTLTDLLNFRRALDEFGGAKEFRQKKEEVLKVINGVGGIERLNMLLEALDRMGGG